jgi:Spy/CpxP family protein refolding chaperone
MKKQLILILIAGMLTLPVHAQTSTNAEPPPPHQGDHGPMGNLSKEEREQVKAAHDKAVDEDPSLEQRMEAARKAMYDAMVNIDPSVAPILEKMKPGKLMGKQNCDPDQRGKKGSNGQAGGRHAPPGMANLTESEREKLKALHEQVKSDPAVIAAHEALKAASTPEARRTAEEELKKASRDAMIKADPTIQPILEKIHPRSDSSSPEGTPPMQ